MREIKYKCYDKKAKKIRNIVEIVFNDKGNVKLIWVKGYDIIEQKEIQIKLERDFILMQYTGLKDKNGKEIYEGDIIQYEDIYKGVVIYSEKYTQFVLKETDIIADECETLGEFNIKVFEVIGNIYDNQELLEVQNEQ